eukprot:TRINITY_DN14733_c0_g1_i1.p1 TRINITY_DN14733_c0_g1~~TRINITY_DN14733_c0_g1_i1.p1  ORF type:complete len:349 (+),score=89.04 TRINITY_DN14733_c0_g1_i1:83-1129(+)
MCIRDSLLTMSGSPPFLSEIDRFDRPYYTYIRRCAISSLWPRWGALGAGWHWIWSALHSLHAELAEHKQAELPMRAGAVLSKLARHDWVLLYECTGFVLASVAGWIQRQLESVPIEDLLLRLNAAWLRYAAWLDALARCTGLLDDLAAKERERNNQRLLPHTPSVIDSGLIAFRREAILHPRTLPRLCQAIQLLQSSALGTQVVKLLMHLDVSDDHLSWAHQCMAEAAGDAAGCSAWGQGRLRARITGPLRERLAELQGSDDDEHLPQDAEASEKLEATLRCQAGPQAADQMHMSWRRGGGPNEFASSGAAARALMSEKESCYRASAHRPEKKHKLRPEEALFQHDRY